MLWGEWRESEGWLVKVNISATTSTKCLFQFQNEHEFLLSVAFYMREQRVHVNIYLNKPTLFILSREDYLTSRGSLWKFPQTKLHV